MMFVDICICYRYYFQEFDLKSNHLTLKVALTNTIKGYTSQNSNENEVLHMFLALFG